MRNAVIYARVSSVGDRQNTQRQVADLTRYAQRNEFNVAHVYEEHISGAVKNEQRQVLCECLDFCFANSTRYSHCATRCSRIAQQTLPRSISEREQGKATATMWTRYGILTPTPTVT